MKATTGTSCKQRLAGPTGPFKGYAQRVLFVHLMLVTMFCFSIRNFQSGGVTTCTCHGIIPLFFPIASIYLPGSVMNALDPSCLAPKFPTKKLMSIYLSVYSKENMLIAPWDR